MKPAASLHWALEFLVSQGLDPFVEELKEEGVVDGVRLPDDFYPVMFLGFKPLDLPPWLPKEVGSQRLSPSERLAWFDELLREYCDSSLTWPLAGDERLKTLRLLRALYLMHDDKTMGQLRRPSFIPAEPSKPKRSPESPSPT